MSYQDCRRCFALRWKAFAPETTASQSTFAAARAPSEECAGPAPAVVELLAGSRSGRGGLLAVGLVVRASLLVQVSRTPFVGWATSTGEAYPLWAVRIAAGHVLPIEAFYQSPLYAYYLGHAVRVLRRRHVECPRVVQFTFGSASLVLVYAIGTRLFSRKVCGSRASGRRSAARSCSRRSRSARRASSW